MDFHVTANPAAFRADREHGIEEVRTGLQIPAAGVFDDDVLSGRGLKPRRPPRLVVPDTLEVALGIGEVVVRVGGFSDQSAWRSPADAVGRGAGKGGG